MIIAKISVSLLTVISAITITSHQRIARHLTSSSSITQTTPGRAQTVSIENTIGVITLSHEDPDHSHTWTAKLFNEDGSIWYEFSFYDENRDHPFDPSRVDFRPFAFNLENFLLVFKCVGEDANRFEVIVNEKTGLKKFVRKNDRAFKYQTWEDHVLDQFAVDFDESNNPLRSMLSMHARLVQAPKDVFFHPVKIERNWLRVRWDVSETEGVKSTRGKKKIGYGWIKWKEGNNII